MLTDAALAYLHYACILILAGALSAEALLLRASPGAATIAALVRADILYMIAAVLALASGAGRLLFGMKSMAFYLSNPWFQAKISLFVVIGLISIGPTRRFIQWRRSSIADAAFMPYAADVAGARRLVMVEVHLLALLPLAAVCMARGFGMV